MNQVEVKDRAATALVLGIISMVIPVVGLITGPLAWSKGNDHIDSVDRGYLAHGRGMAMAGKVLGMIVTWCYILFIGFYASYIAIFLVITLAGGS